MSPFDEGREKIEALRPLVDACNQSLLQQLKERQDAVDAIGAVKATYGMPALQPERQAAMMSAIRLQAEAMGLDPDMTVTVFEAIHSFSVKRQEASLQRTTETA